MLSVFTKQGVKLFWPVLPWRISLELLGPFDYILMFGASLLFILGMVFKQWQRYFGRVAMLLALVYLVVLVTFHFKAANFAEKYANALALEVEDIHLLPQPISSLSWRVIIETKDNRLHDTMINLFLKEPLKVTESSTRARRIAALYKPMDKAIWRIYNRIGSHRTGEGTMYVEKAWKALSESPFNWETRFVVFKGFTEHNGTSCAEFRDLRREGARKDEKGTYLVCAEGEGFVLYQAAEDGDFAKLDRIY